MSKEFFSVIASIVTLFGAAFYMDCWCLVHE